ncbi:MAG: helix-turn-helix transcriptional regulator [Bifidobacteriaceae bacterium]|nr:helix-turn-helix transcriptional regulator [Bifidobacteriaceae bacterium]
MAATMATMRGTGVDGKDVKETMEQQAQMDGERTNGSGVAGLDGVAERISGGGATAGVQSRELTDKQKLALAMRRKQLLLVEKKRRERLSKQHQREQRAVPNSTYAPVAAQRADEPASVSLCRVQGEVLRELRTREDKPLRVIADRAGVSLGYLSEVERGRKEASSEFIVSIAKALDVPLSTVLSMVADRLAALGQ